jgi:hypothetical protein
LDGDRFVGTRHFLGKATRSARSIALRLCGAFESYPRRIRLPAALRENLLPSVVLPSMAECILNHCKIAEASWYDGVGHALNTELKQFAGSAYRGHLQ